MQTCALLAFAAVSFAAPVSAFTVKSGFTTGCHERVTVVAYLQAQTQVPEELDVPGGTWEEVADYLLKDARYQPRTRTEKYFLFSLLTGVRAADNEGFSASNLSTLRAIQSDPEGQYHHCLRAVGDDYLEGNRTTVQGCRDTITDQLQKATEVLGRTRPKQTISVNFTLDQYGTFKVDVWGPAYHVGRAVHVVEDSFTHTLRTPDMRGVIHVMNYAEAIGGSLKEERDGLAHSGAADACNLVTTDKTHPSNRDRVFAAEEATADLLRAVAGLLRGEKQDAQSEVEIVLDKWLRYVPGSELGYDEGCVRDNDYCDSPWLELARLRPSGPILGCAASLPQAQAGHRAGISVVLLLGLTAFGLLVRRLR